MRGIIVLVSLAAFGSSHAHNCGPHERFGCVSSPKCILSCDNLYQVCNRICAYIDCICEDGYAKLNGTCVPIDECPVRKCLQEPNVEFSLCTDCEETCEDTKENCFPFCDKLGCICKEGYVRLNGKCIPAEQCPSHRD